MAEPADGDVIVEEERPLSVVKEPVRVEEEEDKHEDNECEREGVGDTLGETEGVGVTAGVDWNVGETLGVVVTAGVDCDVGEGEVVTAGVLATTD